MKIRLRLVLPLCIGLISNIYAAGPPLVIGTEAYNPPFIQQGGKGEIFGFDIDMMNALCRIMDRPCSYRVMRFTDLLNAVATNKVDAAIDSITITAPRSARVNFSTPYLPSFSRFVTTPNNAKTPFTIEVLKGKTLGGQAGTIFTDQVEALGIQGAKIKLYDKSDDLVAALSNGSVDYIMADNSTATFWAANSAGALVPVGQPMSFGFGYGIAVNLNNIALLNEINRALMQYLKSDDFKKNTFKYLPQQQM